MNKPNNYFSYIQDSPLTQKMKRAINIIADKQNYFNSSNRRYGEGEGGYDIIAFSDDI